jgi:flavin reductase (DIM6/NTAB) family NADH-FMN oxidoreductase RutF
MAPFDQEIFDQLMRELDPAMLIVTAASGDQVGRCLVGFATQASISPPLFAVMLSERNRTFRIAREAPCLGVHLVDAEESSLAELFGGETGDSFDKLGQVEWAPGPDGVPLLACCPNRFVGRVSERHRVGDHVLFLLTPITAQHAPPLCPLWFKGAEAIKSGHDA